MLRIEPRSCGASRPGRHPSLARKVAAAAPTSGQQLPFPWPGSARSRMAVARTRPPSDSLARLTNCPSAAPSRSSPRPPAAPEAGQLNGQCAACSDQLGRRASRCAWWHVGRRDAAPLDLWRAARSFRRASVAVTPSADARALRVAVACVEQVQPTALPPTAPPASCEGDLWGDLRCGGPMNRLAASVVRSRQDSYPTPRPPQGGSEESEQKDRFSAARAGSGRSFE